MLLHYWYFNLFYVSNSRTIKIILVIVHSFEWPSLRVCVANIIAQILSFAMSLKCCFLRHLKLCCIFRWLSFCGGWPHGAVPNTYSCPPSLSPFLPLSLPLSLSPALSVSSPGCVWRRSDQGPDSDRAVGGAHSWRYQSLHWRRFRGEWHWPLLYFI